MFIENKYKKWYDNIINNAQNRKLKGYKEKHHIIPKCIGGSDEKNNIVELTAKEHYLCHLLLIKFSSNTFVKEKMQFAFGKFLQCNRYQNRKLTSYQYNNIRNQVSKARLGKKRSKETCKKISEGQKGKIPWNKGLVGRQKHSDESKQKISNTMKDKGSFNKRFGKEKALEIRNRISETKKGKPSGMLGKTHSEKTKQLMRENMKGTRGSQKRIDICPVCDEKQVTYRHIKFCKERNKK